MVSIEVFEDGSDDLYDKPFEFAFVVLLGQLSDKLWSEFEPFAAIVFQYIMHSF